MPNFVKIPRQMKEFSIQALAPDCSVSLYGSYMLSAVPTNEQLLSEKKTGAKFQIDISKTEGLVCIYTDRRTDGRIWLNQHSSSR